MASTHMEVDDQGGASFHEPTPNFALHKTLTGHKRAVACAKFSPADAHLLATAAADATSKLWDINTGQELKTLTGHAKGISYVAWSPAGRYLCTASDDHSLKLWDVETGKCLRNLLGHTNYVFCCCFSPHGHLLASGSFDETLRVWDVRSSVCLREVPAHSDPITAVDFSWDGTLIVTSSLDGLCRVWDTATAHCLRTLYDKEASPVSNVCFTPNSKYFLSSSLDSKKSQSRMQLWDYERGKAIKCYQGHVQRKYCVPAVFCTPHGTAKPVLLGKGQRPQPGAHTPWVVTGSEDGFLYVYGLNSQQVLQTVGKPGTEGEPATGHKDAVMCVDCHATKPMLASSGHVQDCAVKLWMHSAGEQDMQE